MNYKNAAYKILSVVGSPMTLKDIMDISVQQQLTSKFSKNPQACMATALYRDIKRKGIKSQFIQKGKGTFGLREWEPVDELYDQVNNKESLKAGKSIIYHWKLTKQSVIIYIRESDPYEHYCPKNHFLVILDTISQIIDQGGIFFYRSIIDNLSKKELEPSRYYNDKSERYKISMVIRILIFENIIIPFNNNRQKYFKLIGSQEDFVKWRESNQLT